MGTNDCCGDDRFLGVECAWPAVPPAAPAPMPRRREVLRRVVLLAAAALLLAGLWQVSRAGYIHAKAYLAQVLIADAWARTRDGSAHAKPWPWADTWPVAQLRAPHQNAAAFVLAGADGRTLAFGPGHVYGTPLPGEPGNSVIGAHRDTHFAFLRALRRGDPIDVTTSAGATVRYRVTETLIVHKSDIRVLESEGEARELTLVTCYPFDALRAGGPLRYVVRAVAARTDAARGTTPSGARRAVAT